MNFITAIKQLLQPTAQESKPHLAYIDILRALSILYIVGFWHMMNYIPQLHYQFQNIYTIHATVLALGVFMLMSGYLLGNNRQLHNPTFANLKKFYRQRLIRLYPPFIAAGLVFILFQIDSASHIFGGFFLYPMLLEPPPLTLWFICMILVMYLLAPVIMVYRSSAWQMALVGLVMEWLLYLYQIQTHYPDPRLSIYMPCFFAGLILSQHPHTFQSKSWWAAVVACSALGLVISGPLSFGQLLQGPGVLFALSGSVLVFAIAQRWGHWLPGQKIYAAGAYASFFVYLFHRPIYMIFTLIYREIASPSVWTLMYLITIACPVIFVAGFYMQRAYDNLLNIYVLKPQPTVKPKQRGLPKSSSRPYKHV